MRRLGLSVTASQSIRILLIGGFLAMLAANLPGYLSADSVAQLYEGRLGVHESWGPAAYAAVLGFFDGIVRGTGLYVVASGLVLFASLLHLRTLRPQVSWAAAAVALAMVLSPALLIYQAIVWKDVLFANLAVASFVLLAHVARVWDTPGRRPWLALCAIVLMLALGAQVRQNGLVAAVFAAAILAWTARRAGWRAAAAWGLGGLAGVVCVSLAIGAASQPREAGPDIAAARGVRILQQYDIIGAAAHDPSLRLDILRRADPRVDAVVRSRAVAVYSPQRVDYLALDPGASRVLWDLPDRIISDQWRSLVVGHPGPYLAHRWDVFRWVFLTPMIDSCLPVWTGVEGPAVKLDRLGLDRKVDGGARSMFNYATWFLDTPAFSHLSYAILAVLVAGLLLLRRDPADMVVVGLLAAALAFTASFFVISLACDYRYLYFLDLAAMTGLFYLALDPPLAQLGLRRPR